MLLVGAIEAVGELRDLRAAPVMRQILDGAESNAEVARAAAEALGTFETDDEVAFLAAHARAGDRFERAAISGLGFARGAASVAALRARLESHPPAETAEALADAIGWLGSSWAWTALGPARHEEGTALRDELSATLVAAFPTYEGAAREAIARALLVIDHPSTPNRLATLRAHASPALASSLQSLERRWLRVTR
jgi:HEAT repeat protein